MTHLFKKIPDSLRRQISHFGKKIGEDGESLGLSPEEIQSIEDDANAIVYVYGN